MLNQKRWKRTASGLLLLLLGIAFMHQGVAQGKNPYKAVSNKDANGDGKVSLEEWPKSPKIFKKIDKDGDGFLSPEDFAIHWGMAPTTNKQATPSPSKRKPKRNSDYIPIIDAHSQIDCNVPEKLVLKRLKELKISRVLLSVRGCKGWSTSDLEARTIKWAQNNPNRISPLVTAKTDGWSFKSLDHSSVNAFRQRAKRDEFIGMGEVLVQHAAHNHSKLQYPELDIPMDDKRVKAAIDIAQQRGWPVTLHIELNDNEKKSAQTLSDLNQLLKQNPETQFLLIHMGQIASDEARTLLEQHRNIHFLTSHADNFTAFLLRKQKKRGTSQTGWINLFEDNCELSNCPDAWKPEWKALITRYPSQFVLAFDNVFPKHWQKPYQIRVGIWRRALKLLPVDVAHAVAHENAERLWNLPPAKWVK